MDGDDDIDSSLSDYDDEEIFDPTEDFLSFLDKLRDGLDKSYWAKSDGWFGLANHLNAVKAEIDRLLDRIIDHFELTGEDRDRIKPPRSE